MYPFLLTSIRLKMSRAVCSSNSTSCTPASLQAPDQLETISCLVIFGFPPATCFHSFLMVSTMESPPFDGWRTSACSAANSTFIFRVLFAPICTHPDLPVVSMVKRKLLSVISNIVFPAVSASFICRSCASEIGCQSPLSQTDILSLLTSASGSLPGVVGITPIKLPVGGGKLPVGGGPKGLVELWAGDILSFVKASLLASGGGHSLIRLGLPVFMFCCLPVVRSGSSRIW
mmetsp:Transcript_47317/g.86917  ORF Transcript_47317/g.86917 Transcript_47317/m.86917 type:complete len:231 (-) Transcript_47317:212-904(-)